MYPPPQIGDRIRTLDGREGKVVEICDLSVLLERDGVEYDPTTDEVDLPYLVCETDLGGTFQICEYEADRI